MILDGGGELGGSGKDVVLIFVVDVEEVDEKVVEEVVDIESPSLWER